MLEQAWVRLRAEQALRGRAELFDALRAKLEGRQLQREGANAPYPELAPRFATTEEGALKVAVHHWPQRLRKLLVAEVRDTLPEDDDCVDEHARQKAEPPPGLQKTAELQALFPELYVIGLAGRGGMGAAYQAYDPRLDRHVALKVQPPHRHHDSTFAERFARECRTLARLQHPHILTVYDIGERNGLPYLVTEFVDFGIAKLLGAPSATHP